MKKDSKNVIIISLTFIIIILIALVILFTTNTISFNNKNNIGNPDNNTSKLTNEEAMTILKNSYNSTVRHIFNEGVSYCGDYATGPDTTISLNDSIYSKSATFSSFSELDSYVKKYLTEELLSTTRYNQSITINGQRVNSYYEKDNSLYCNNWDKGSNMLLSIYSETESNFTITTINENSFSGTINAVYYDTNNENKTVLNINVTLINQNNNWLIDSYKEN